MTVFLSANVYNESYIIVFSKNVLRFLGSFSLLDAHKFEGPPGSLGAYLFWIRLVAVSSVLNSIFFQGIIKCCWLVRCPLNVFVK